MNFLKNYCIIMLKFQTLLRKLKEKEIMVGERTMEMPEAYVVKHLF